MGNKSYRCYLIDAGHRIRSCEQIECADDAAAALKIEQLLASSSHSSAELWLGERLIGKWGNGGSADAHSTSIEEEAPSAGTGVRCQGRGRAGGIR